MNFEIDEKATIGSILTALRTEGIKTGDVAKAVDGISEKPLRNALKEAGYMFSNKAPKGWHYIGEGVEPTEQSVFDYVKRISPRVNKPSQTVHTEYTPINTEVASGNTEFIPSSSVIHPQFTRNEVSMLMEMLHEWKQNKVAEQSGAAQGLKQVHERIKALPQGDKTRKTIVIDKGIGERLDDYCKAERVNKSDILHLALMDFLGTNEES